MSVISSRSTVSSVSSILKTPGMRKKISGQSNRVRFKLPENLKNVLINYEAGQEIKTYEDLIYTVRDAQIKDSELIDLLTQVRQCISLLGNNQKKFVETLLNINWIDRSPEAATSYKEFLEDLVCVHIYHCKLVIDKLVCLFKVIADENKVERWKDGEPPDEDAQKLRYVHEVFFKFLKIVPMSSSILLQCLSSRFPYFKNSTHSHIVYLHSSLEILEYAPQLRSELLTLIINRLIIIDVNAPRSEIESYRDREEDADEQMFQIDSVNNQSAVQEHPLAHTLDMCMEKILEFIYEACYPNNTFHVENLKKIYFELLQIFEKVILPTYASHHVQFIMFYICSFKVAVADAFLNWLWQRVSNPNVASIIRQSAVAYIASLLARANFITIDLVVSTLLEMVNWIHSYIAAQDSLESANSDVRVHTVFYSICQAVFYVVGFKHRDLVSTKKNLLFLQSLNFTKIISCRLNPLRVCLPAVVQHFAAVTRTYQIAYCYPVIEHNSRSNLPVLQNTTRVTTRLDAFFPFDPYVLSKSSHRISPLYLHYQGSINMDTVIENSKDESDEDDDFMDVSYPQQQQQKQQQQQQQQQQLDKDSTNNHFDQFSYSTSPGFIHS